jgi:hypothetical protein
MFLGHKCWYDYFLTAHTATNTVLMSFLKWGCFEMCIKLITENPYIQTHPEKQKTLKKRVQQLTNMISLIVMITTILQNIVVQTCLCK